MCSLPVIYVEPNYGGDNADNGDLLLKVPCVYCYTQCPQPCSKPPLTHASVGDSWILPGKSGSVSCGVMLLSPESWWAQGSVCAPQGTTSQSCVSYFEGLKRKPYEGGTQDFRIENSFSFSMFARVFQVNFEHEIIFSLLYLTIELMFRWYPPILLSWIEIHQDWNTPYSIVPGLSYHHHISH